MLWFHNYLQRYEYNQELPSKSIFFFHVYQLFSESRDNHRTSRDIPSIKIKIIITFVPYINNETYEYQFGSMDNAKPTIDSNTNIRLKFFFADVSVETKRIASLTVKAYSSTWGNSDMTFNFRDLPVEWK